MQKYQKPIARNLGDLQPAQGLCTPGQSAGFGSEDQCINGNSATSPSGICASGNFAQGSCFAGTSPNYTPYPYG